MNCKDIVYIGYIITVVKISEYFNHSFEVYCTGDRKCIFFLKSKTRSDCVFQYK